MVEQKENGDIEPKMVEMRQCLCVFLCSASIFLVHSMNMYETKEVCKTRALIFPFLVCGNVKVHSKCIICVGNSVRLGKTFIYMQYIIVTGCSSSSMSTFVKHD